MVSKRKRTGSKSVWTRVAHCDSRPTKAFRPAAVNPEVVLVSKSVIEILSDAQAQALFPNGKVHAWEQGGGRCPESLQSIRPEARISSRNCSAQIISNHLDSAFPVAARHGVQQLRHSLSATECCSFTVPGGYLGGTRGCGGTAVEEVETAAESRWHVTDAVLTGYFSEGVGK